jgi:hypothetical protein
MKKIDFLKISLTSLMIVLLFLSFALNETKTTVGAWVAITAFNIMLYIWGVHSEIKKILENIATVKYQKFESQREADVLRFEREWSESSDVLDNFKIKYNDFRKENIHLFNSAKNLKLSVKELSELISFCKRCENRDYTIWELYKNSLIISCDACKKKSTIKNKVVPQIFNNYNYHLKLDEYCKATNQELRFQLLTFDLIKKNYSSDVTKDYSFDVDYIVWEKFPFKKREFKANTPLHRGITFKGFGTKKLEEPKDEKRSRRISQNVQDRVWNRDGRKCCECGSNENLEFDHIIPHSKGGANTYRNIQLLCEPCNRSKSAKIG